MPYHNFACENCGEEFEEWLKFGSSDFSHIMCPRCRKYQIRKKISAPLIIFVGDGFYSTDNREANSDE